MSVFYFYIYYKTYNRSTSKFLYDSFYEADFKIFIEAKFIDKLEFINLQNKLLSIKKGVKRNYKFDEKLQCKYYQVILREFCQANYIHHQ